MNTRTTSPCADKVLLIHALIDGELDAVHALNCDEHLKICPACAAAYNQALEAKKVISQKTVRHRAPEALRERIMAAAGTDAVKAAVRSRATGAAVPWWRSWKHWQSWSLPISALTLAASLALFLAMPGNRTVLQDELVAGHVRSLLADHLTDIATSDQHAVKPWFNGKLDFAPPVIDLADRGFPLEGGRLDYIGQRTVAALIYRRRAHVINLFVWPATSNSAAAGFKEGYNLIHWTQAGLCFWAVSDLNATELREFQEDFSARAPT